MKCCGLPRRGRAGRISTKANISTALSWALVATFALCNSGTRMVDLAEASEGAGPPASPPGPLPTIGTTSGVPGGRHLQRSRSEGALGMLERAASGSTLNGDPPRAPVSPHPRVYHLPTAIALSASYCYSTLGLSPLGFGGNARTRTGRDAPYSWAGGCSWNERRCSTRERRGAVSHAQPNNPSTENPAPKNLHPNRPTPHTLNSKHATRIPCPNRAASHG